MLADQLDYVVGVDPHRDSHALAVVGVVSRAVLFEALEGAAAVRRERATIPRARRRVITRCMRLVPLHGRTRSSEIASRRVLCVRTICVGHALRATNKSRRGHSAHSASTPSRRATSRMISRC